MRRLILTGHSGFAHEIPLERFAADPYAACFIAYFTARKNKRRLFSLTGKENPVDHLAEALLARLDRPGARTDWEMLADVPAARGDRPAHRRTAGRADGPLVVGHARYRGRA